ncbi:MAG TPA: hypothetical protein VLR92_06225 [Blastocatellia bacterium]|nr:hypothetical protein [Blastocatellia bacterium]
MKKCLMSLAICALTQMAYAQPSRVLLPVYLSQPVHGAYGAIWQSEFAVHNGTLAGEYLMDVCSPVDPNEGCILVGSADEEIKAGETKTRLPSRYPAPTNGVAGAVVYFTALRTPTRDLNDLSFQLRISDVSRSTVNAGTEVPVVRETQFRTSTIHLLNVPTAPQFRVALRIFEMNLDFARFAVRVFDHTTNAPISSTLVTTTTPPQGPERFRPGFAQIDNFAALTGQPVRIEIEPLTRGTAAWAYISLTNNESQQITLVTPE